MVGHPALRIDPTETRAGVLAALLHAGRGLTALRAHETLRPTVGRRADHPGLAGADTDSVTFSELTVGSAGVRITGVVLLRDGDPGGDESTLSDRVSRVSQETGADGLVTVGVADSVDATDSRAGVDTLVVDTGPVGGTVTVQDTLRSAGQVGISEVSWYTGAGSGSLLGPALSIGATGCWVAGINDGSLGGGGGRDPPTLSERISIVSRRTSTYRVVVHHLTLGIGTTGSWTGVDTFLPDTGQVAGTVGVDGALGSAVGRNSDVVGQTGAGRHLPGHVVLALREGAAGRGVAGIDVQLRDHRSYGRLHLDTVTEGVSGVSRGTLTDGVVVGDLTSGVVTTGPWAGVDTLLVDAGSQLTTVRADHTLWPAVGRVALVARDTGADTDSVHLSVLTVGTAGVRVTGVSDDWPGWGWRDQSTGGGGVSCVSLVTGTDGIVVPH